MGAGSSGLPVQEVDHFIGSCLVQQAPGSLLAFKPSLCSQRFFGYSNVYPDAATPKQEQKKERVMTSRHLGSPMRSAEHASESILSNVGIDVKAKSKYNQSNRHDPEHKAKMAAKWHQFSSALKKLQVVDGAQGGGLCFGGAPVRGDPAIKRTF